MEPSNLGQIIGRLLMGEGITAAGQSEVQQPPHVERKLRVSNRRQQILDLVRERGVITQADVAVAFSTSTENACMLLLAAFRVGHLKRTGSPTAYSYSLPDA